MAEIKSEFWDSIETKDCINISEKDRVTLNIAEKNSKKYIFLQKEFIKNNAWNKGKGFSIEVDKKAKEVFESALQILSGE